MGIIIPVLKILILAGVAAGVYRTFKYIAGRKFIKNSIATMYERINSSGKKREESEKAIRQMYGNYGKKGLINHIDENIKYSGLQNKCPLLTTELFLVGEIVVLAAAFLSASVLSGSILKGAAVTALLVFGVELYFNGHRQRCYDRVEDELLPFINSIDAYAASTDDIISIFEKSIPVLNGPLKDAVYKAVEQSKRTGNCSEVLRNLEDSIEHPFFKKLIRNLEISSRHSANYKDIITECRYQLDEAASNAKKLEKIYKDGRHDIILVIIAGTACVTMALTGMLGYPVGEFFSQMWDSIMGRFILTGAAGSVLVSLYIAFIASQKRGRG